MFLLFGQSLAEATVHKMETIDEKLAVRFLLGDLPEESRFKIEERFFKEDRFYKQLSCDPGRTGGRLRSGQTIAKRARAV